MKACWAGVVRKRGIARDDVGELRAKSFGREDPKQCFQGAVVMCHMWSPRW
ncbi:Hypothetical protein A7982_07179 [Minicystis rosea]|nr:Hypothetical protein A7982_07179 [Minicystis rosea]